MAVKADGTRGRGRLSSLDLLPPEAEEDVIWAYGELRGRKKTQEDILASLNLRLAVRGLPPISKSAFSRAAVRTARLAHRLGEVREIAGVMAQKFEDGGDEHLTLMLSETIKTAVFEMLENAGRLKADGLSAEMMMNFSRALKFSEEAKKTAADTRKIIEKDFRAKAEEAVENVSKLKGISEEAKAELRAMLFGAPSPKAA